MPGASVPASATAVATISRAKDIEPTSCRQRLAMWKGICSPDSSHITALCNEPGNCITTETVSLRGPGAGLNTTTGTGLSLAFAEANGAQVFVVATMVWSACAM